MDRETHARCVVNPSGLDASLDVPRDPSTKNQVFSADCVRRTQDQHAQPKVIGEHTENCTRQVPHAHIMPASMTAHSYAGLPNSVNKLLRTTIHVASGRVVMPATCTTRSAMLITNSAYCESNALAAKPFLQHPILRLKELNDDQLMAMHTACYERQEKRQ